MPEGKRRIAELIKRRLQSRPMRTTKLIAIGVVFGFAAIPLVAICASPTLGYLELIAGIMQEVQRDYVRPVQVDVLAKNALKGMLTRLDPHSDYLDEQEYRETQADISGKFGGIGIEISVEDGVPKIIAPIDGTPAAKAHLEPGDVIVGISGQSTQGMDASKVINAIRGKPGSAVTLMISRGDKAPFKVTLQRDIIRAPSVTSELEPEGFGYVRISQFVDDTPKNFKDAIESLKRRAGGQLKGLVLDLRNDPGGLLLSAVAVAGDFLRGDVVVTIRGRRSSENQVLKSESRGDLLAGMPIVVLINAASASASEIVAGALQDHHRATVMGTQSYGKGSVQTVIPLNGRGALRLTTALYYTPNGRSIQDEGISPDVVVEASKDAQIESGIRLSENALSGAIANPGSLDGKSGATNTKRGAVIPYSPPMKPDIIGTPQDTQLKSAISFLQSHAR
jgi:carboxyl-terminal processing protease